ncbi:MAG: hypothetical protein COA32_08920 [Fluviicola sp.]|nr:MAG: hypothetical protein COA32_08920 [Fluviicola sp.]
MNLDISIIIGIIGLVLTAYSIYLFVKKKKYPGKLTLIKENSVGLFNELANTFEEIKIEFKDSPIDKNIIYIKGSLINNGENDLNFNNSEVPVGLHLKENLKWIKSKITKSSENVNCTTEIETDRVLNFKCGYLKINEFFQFEALIETNDSKFDSGNIFDQFDPKHRLINTQRIGITSYLDERQRQKKQSSVKSYLAMLGLMVLLYGGSAAYQTYFDASTKFEYVSEGEKFEVTPLTNNKVEINGIGNDVEKTITINEFKENYKPIIPQKNFWENLVDFIWVFVIMLFFYSLSIIWDFFQLRKSRQLSNIIDKEKN